jgi:acyl carrier protein phosphodiesterase
MNFLAHFHLAWPDEGLIVGGLEGDYYKGPLRGDLTPSIEQGVKLHRAIDAHTDQHPLIAELRNHFPRELRRYAGILIDISFDHYLTRYWPEFSQTPLPDFAQQIYKSLSAREAELSPGSRTMAQRMREHDILNCYHDWRSVTGTAARIGERFRRGNPLLEVDWQLQPIRDRLETTFLEFYPQLQSFSIKERSKMN